MVPKPMTLLAAICLMINLTGSCFVLAFMLVTVIVIAQEAYLGRSAVARKVCVAASGGKRST
jgi:hypothetical protein